MAASTANVANFFMVILVKWVQSESCPTPCWQDMVQAWALHPRVHRPQSATTGDTHASPPRFGTTPFHRCHIPSELKGCWRSPGGTQRFGGMGTPDTVCNR